MIFALATVGPVRADDPQSKASAAVTAVLFEHDADEFASYGIRNSGFVDITFARNTPGALYSEILSKLQEHPDIKGRAGREGRAVVFALLGSNRTHLGTD